MHSPYRITWAAVTGEHQPVLGRQTFVVLPCLLFVQIIVRNIGLRCWLHYPPLPHPVAARTRACTSMPTTCELARYHYPFNCAYCALPYAPWLHNTTAGLHFPPHAACSRLRAHRTRTLATCVLRLPRARAALPAAHPHLYRLPAPPCHCVLCDLLDEQFTAFIWYAPPYPPHHTHYTAVNCVRGTLHTTPPRPTHYGRLP